MRKLGSVVSQASAQMNALKRPVFPPMPDAIAPKGGVDGREDFVRRPARTDSGTNGGSVVPQQGSVSDNVATPHPEPSCPPIVRRCRRKPRSGLISTRLTCFPKTPPQTPSLPRHHHAPRGASGHTGRTDPGSPITTPALGQGPDKPALTARGRVSSEGPVTGGRVSPRQVVGGVFRSGTPLRRRPWAGLLRTLLVASSADAPHRRRPGEPLPACRAVPSWEARVRRRARLLPVVPEAQRVYPCAAAWSSLRAEPGPPQGRSADIRSESWRDSGPWPATADDRWGHRLPRLKARAFWPASIRSLRAHEGRRCRRSPEQGIPHGYAEHRRLCSARCEQVLAARRTTSARAVQETQAAAAARHRQNRRRRTAHRLTDGIAEREEPPHAHQQNAACSIAQVVALDGSRPPAWWAPPRVRPRRIRSATNNGIWTP